MDDNYEELPTLENHWEEYTWVSRRSAEGVIMYDPPIDPTFYTPSSHDNAPDWDLFQSIDLIATVIEGYGDIEERIPRIHQLTLVSRYMEEILVKRKAERDVEDEATKVCEDEIDVDTLIPFPPPPDVWSEPPRITSTFLITAPKYREPRYYFPPLRRHRQPKSRNTTRTSPPPYIRPPKPHPMSPDFTAAHLQTNILRTSAPPDPFPQNQTYQFHHLHFNNPITHLVYGHVANIPRIPSFPAIIATSYFASQIKVAYACPRCSRTNIAWRRVEVC